MCFMIAGQFQMSRLKYLKKKIATIQLSVNVSSDGH